MCCDFVGEDRTAKSKHSGRQIHLFPMMVLVAPDHWIGINDTGEDRKHGFGSLLVLVLVLLTVAPGSLCPPSFHLLPFASRIIA